MTDSSKTIKPKTNVPHATRHVYDVIVLGAQLAGTVAGALLAKRGYRVLQIDPDGAGTGYEDRSYRLPYAPSMMPSPRLMPEAEAALAELGVVVDLERALRAAASPLQVLFPKHRLDLLGSEGPAWPAELAREFPAEHAALTGALQAASGVAEATDPFFRQASALPFPPEGFFERRAVKRAAADCAALERAGGELKPTEGQPLGEALKALSRFLVYLDDEEAGPLTRSRPLSQLLHGAYRLPGGATGLREVMRKRLTEVGGDLLGGEGDPAVVEELVFEGSELTGIKLASNKNVFHAHHVIAAMPVSQLAPLVPPKARKGGLSALLESVRARHSLLPVNVVVRAEGLPLGLKDLALIIDGDPELGPVLLEVLPARKGDKEIADERVLCAASYVSLAEHDAGETRLRELAARIQAAAFEVCPFIEKHVLFSSVPFLDAKNARARLSQHPLLEVADEKSLGIGGLPHRTSVKNLFLASREVVPGLGIEGEFLTAQRAAGLVQEALKKHNPLK